MTFADILEENLEEVDKDLELHKELLEEIKEAFGIFNEYLDNDTDYYIPLEIKNAAAKNILMILVKYGILEKE